nr:hypothetical protein [Fundicoccus ignavus]
MTQEHFKTDSRKETLILSRTLPTSGSKKRSLFASCNCQIVESFATNNP